ncbi:MAG: HlyC/CorC family transporter [Planctomycetes bacterium]|nr:HlyC/CorC family transporter [Planctomycetota bacterium]
MSSTALFWTSFCSLAATAIASLGFRALREFSRHDLEALCRHRGHPKRFSQVLRHHETVAMGVESLATFTTVVGTVSGWLWLKTRWQFSDEITWLAFLASCVTLSLILAAVTTWIPWAFSRIFSAGFLFYTWPLWKTLSALASPLVWGAKSVDLILHRVVGQTPQQVDEETIEEEIRTIVTEGHREGLLEEDAREMIEGVIELGDADVSEIMTPRTDMHMIPLNMPWDELVADVIEATHTRIPVFDKNRDDVVGVLYSKDLLPELATGDPASRTPIRDLVRKPVFVPETKPVDDLLQMFQQLRTHIAVVLDEYGGVAGLVTIEDVLEEIVGEIVDEYDKEVAQEIERIDDDIYEALGRTHIDEINDAMKIDLPDDGDFDTIGGFVFTEIGRVPIAGESLVWQNQIRIEVLDASERRINRVRITRLSEAERESA